MQQLNQPIIPLVVEENWDRLSDSAKHIVQGMLARRAYGTATRYVESELNPKVIKMWPSVPMHVDVEDAIEESDDDDLIPFTVENSNALIRAEFEKVAKRGQTCIRVLTWVSTKEGQEFTIQDLLNSVEGNHNTLKGYFSKIKRRKILTSRPIGGAVKIFKLTPDALSIISEEIAKQKEFDTYRRVLLWLLETEGEPFTMVDPCREIEGHRATIAFHVCKTLKFGFIEVWKKGKQRGRPDQRISRIYRLRRDECS